MKKIYLGTLQFGEGGEGASGEGAAMASGEPTGETGTASQNEGADNGAVEGDHAPSQNGEQKSDLKALLKSDPELKKQYDESMQSMIRRRLQDQDKLTKSNAEYQRMASLLAEAFPDAPQDGSAASMMQYLEGKNELWAEAAAKAGMSVETYKRMKSYERENQELLGQQRAQQEEMRRQQMFAAWDAQVPEVKAKYPDFDVQAEASDPATGQRFTDLLGMGWNMLQAYEAIHVNDLVNRSAVNASQQAAAQTAQQIRASQGRPVENGATRSTAVKNEKDPSKFTDEDFERINRQVKAGGYVSFD